MITIPTVLILGAGASINYGFPSGLVLKAEICKEIKHKYGSYSDLVKYKDEEHVQDFYNNLLLSSEMSIDAFLEHNIKYVEIGKRVIANILIRKEKHDELFDKWIEKWLEPTNEDKHWYQFLFSKLNAPFEEFESNNLKIITFNYDRSLEYFLLESMKAKYSEEDNNAILEKLHKIPILHIYGKLGNLPEYDLEKTCVPYDLLKIRENDETWQRKKIYEASKNIITIHQSEEMSDVLTQAHDFLDWAKRIYFLGFGFYQINMERLFLLNGVNLLKELGGRCFGTAMNVSPHHKRFLAQFGLSQMQNDLRNEVSRGIKPVRFPNDTIYNFLYYSHYSNLD